MNFKFFLLIIFVIKFLVDWNGLYLHRNVANTVYGIQLACSR